VLEEPPKVRGGLFLFFNDVPGEITSIIFYVTASDSYLVLYQFLQRDLLLGLLLLLVLFQHKAGRQGVPVHTDVAPTRTHPEPAVLIVLDGIQEVPAHLQRNNGEGNVKLIDVVAKRQTVQLRTVIRDLDPLNLNLPNPAPCQLSLDCIQPSFVGISLSPTHSQIIDSHAHWHL